MLSGATTTSTRTGDQALVREINLSIILNSLRERAPISRAKLAAATGLNKATVSSLVKELLEAKLVHEIGMDQAEGGGRPAILLELNPAAGCIVGVNVSADFITVILTDFAAKTLWRREERIDRLWSQADVVEHLLADIRSSLTQAELDDSKVFGLGLGVLGQRNLPSSELRSPSDLWWRDGSLQTVLERELGFPVYVDNETNLAILCETYWGVARGFQNVLYLGAGQALAVAIVLDGRVLSGPPNPGGDVGHMTIDVDGPVCHCGHRGCWETFSTESAVLRRVLESTAAGRASSLHEMTHGDSAALTIPLVVQAAQAGDSVASDALRETGKYLGIGLVNLINAFNPEVIILGGSLSVASDFLLPEINREIVNYAKLWPRCPQVLLAAYGTDASVTGAIAAVYQRIFSQPSLSRVPV